MHDLNAEDGEPPEDEEVHPPGGSVSPQRLLAHDEFLLTQDILENRIDPFPNPVEPRYRRNLGQHRKAPIESAPQETERDHQNNRKDKRTHSWRPH